MKSCNVPRTTSVGFGRKSGSTCPEYLSARHPPRTSAGATNPSRNAVRFGSGERIEKSLLLCLRLFSLIRSLLGCEDHLDIRATVLLTSGFGRVLSDRVTGTASDRLKPRRWNVWKVLDDVVLH